MNMVVWVEAVFLMVAALALVNSEIVVSVIMLGTLILAHGFRIQREMVKPEPKKKKESWKWFK